MLATQNKLTHQTGVFKSHNQMHRVQLTNKNWQSYQCNEPRLIAQVVFETDWNFVKLACELINFKAYLSTIFIIVAPWDMGPGSKLDTISL